MGCGIYFINNNLFPNISEADRMRNRIAELQKEIIEQTKLVNYLQYSANKSAMQARRSLANGISNPMGASDADRKIIKKELTICVKMVISLMMLLRK